MGLAYDINNTADVLESHVQYTEDVYVQYMYQYDVLSVLHLQTVHA